MLPSSAIAFTSQDILYHSRCHKNNDGASSSLNLIPISEAWDTTTQEPSQQSSSFASLLPNLGCKSFNSEGMLIHSSDEEMNKRYRLYLATNVEDLPPIAQLTIDVFDATAITLSSTSTEWSAFEQAMVGIVVEPVIGMYHAYSQAVGYTEVLSGRRKRMRNRLVLNNNQNVNNEEENDDEDDDCYDWLAPLVVPNDGDTVNDSTNTLESIAARSSLILALARPIPTSTTSGEEMEVVASIELRLQPTDAKIPFSQPWLDKIERKLAHALPFAMMKEEHDNTESTSKPNTADNSIHNAPLRPYLCNLCVTPTLRSLGIGRALCRIVETIAKEKWGYSHIYLHVDPTNDAARTLYEKEGYVDVGKRWNVLWAGGAEEISYYVKSL